MENFKENVDAWIKQIRGEFSAFSGVPRILQETVDNTQHNYELIYELKEEIEELRQELSTLKLIQVINLKEQQAKNNSIKSG